MGDFRPIPGFESYEINRAGIVRKRRHTCANDTAPLHVPLATRAGDGLQLVPDDPTVIPANWKSGRNVWRSIPLLRALAFELPMPRKPRKRGYTRASTDHPGEIWVDVLGAEGRHEVSNMGRVRHYRTQKVLRGSVIGRNRYAKGRGLVARKGDVYVCLSQGSKSGSKGRAVSRLVCTAFHGKPERGMEANHKDGDLSNNRADNLEWLTKRRNIQHGWETGLIKSPRGLQARRAKLTADQVREIRTLKGSVSGPELARKYGVSRNTIVRVHNRTNYADVS